jgi:hypothetical protein
MTDDKYRAPETGSVEGRVVQPTNEAELREAVDAAFDYRGDVTIELHDGVRVEGYVFNRDPSGAAPTLQLFPTDGGVRMIPYAAIARIAFTGADTASGKTWEAWVAKKASQREADTQRVIAEAKARGHL